MYIEDDDEVSGLKKKLSKKQIKLKSEKTENTYTLTLTKTDQETVDEVEEIIKNFRVSKLNAFYQYDLSQFDKESILELFRYKF